MTSSVGSIVDRGAVAANSGAGGRGLRGLPPYRDDGVPGRGLPLISAGSYARFDGGGLVQSIEDVELREGDPGRICDALSGELCRATGGIGSNGACPRLEAGREFGNGTEAAEGRPLNLSDALYLSFKFWSVLRLKITRAFRVEAAPVIDCCEPTTCFASDSKDSNRWSFSASRTLVKLGAVFQCIALFGGIETALRLTGEGLLKFAGGGKEGTYGLYSVSLLWGSNLIVDPFPPMFEDVDGPSSSVGVLK